MVYPEGNELSMLCAVILTGIQFCPNNTSGYKSFS